MLDYDKQIRIHKQLLSSSMLTFSRKMFEYVNETPYIVGEHHEKICKALDDVIHGKTRKLIINIAPRYGKTALVSQMFIAYGFALNPRSKFLHLSYSGSLVVDNSIAVQNVIKSQYFQALFEARLPRYANKAKWETIQGGGEYATSTLGQITGFGAGRVDSDMEYDENAIDEYITTYNPDRFSGCIVIDDPIKPDEALSDNVREKINLRFETTIRSRVNSRKTPIVIIMQRLHEHDLCGYLMENEPDEWTVLSLPVIQYDSLGNERPLWEFKHNLEELHKLENANKFVFETQYMQNPTPMEGLMYPSFKTYDILPMRRGGMKGNYTDSADTGTDWLCSIDFIAYPDAYYVTNVLYTKKPMEYTEQAMAQMVCKDEVEKAFVESNNGGRIFMRNVERTCREYGNRKTTFIPFAQRHNKNIRIYQRAQEVCNMLIFPSDWERRFPEFARDLKGYRKEGRNAHDDAPDACTGIIEKCEEFLNVRSDSELLRDFL